MCLSVVTTKMREFGEVEVFCLTSKILSIIRCPGRMRARGEERRAGAVGRTGRDGGARGAAEVQVAQPGGEDGPCLRGGEEGGGHGRGCKDGEETGFSLDSPSTPEEERGIVVSESGVEKGKCSLYRGKRERVPHRDQSV